MDNLSATAWHSLERYVQGSIYTLWDNKYHI